MNVEFNINDLTFGSDDAELDEKRGFLGKVFLKTSIYHRVKKNLREIVIGRKGAGKSAICLMLNDVLGKEGFKTTLLTPDALSQKKIQQLKTSSINKDESYVLSWKYMLLVAIAKDLIVQNHTIQFDDAKKHLKSIRQFLIDNEEIDSTFFDKVTKKASALSKFSIKAYGVEGSVEARHLEIQHDAAKELEGFQQSLRLLFTNLKDIQLVLLIDKVDDIWNQTEESEMMIIGLLKAVHFLNASLPNVHILLFLRSDIYDILKFNDSDKLHSLEERLDWKAQDLKHLIAMRAKASAKIRTNNVDVLWDTIFDESVEDKPSFQYLLERTLMRPRDIIQFCNYALTIAQDNGHDHITSRDILDAEKQYSNWKLKDISSEYLVQYPYLDELLSLFQAFKSEFSREEFDKRYDESKSRLTRHPDLQTTNSAKILQILFIIGFLGTRREEKNIFVYDDPLILLPQHNLIVVHPVFHQALGLQSTLTIKQDSQAVLSQINVAGDIAGRDIIARRYIDIQESENRELQVLERQLNDLMAKQALLQSKTAEYVPNSLPNHLISEIADLEVQIDNATQKIEQVRKSQIEFKFNKERLILDSEYKAKQEEAARQNDAVTLLQVKRDYERNLQLLRDLQKLELEQLTRTSREGGWNLTRKEMLVEEVSSQGWFANPAGRQGYEVILLERVGDSGTRFYHSLKPGETLRTSERLFGKFIVLSVDIRNRILAIDKQFPIPNKDMFLFLKIGVHYRVLDARVVAMETQDPLRELREKVIATLTREILSHIETEITPKLIEQTVRSIGNIYPLGLAIEDATISEFNFVPRLKYPEDKSDAL